LHIAVLTLSHFNVYHSTAFLEKDYSVLGLCISS